MHDETGWALKMDEARNGPPLGRGPISLSWTVGAFLPFGLKLMDHVMLLFMS